jgi:pullulanase/glycogen debranching enzyme
MLPADPRTLGSTVTEGGTNFAIWSNAADAVELCLFNEVNGKMVETRFAMSHRNGPIWHVTWPACAQVNAMDIGFMAPGCQNMVFGLTQQSFCSIPMHMQ